MLKQKTIQNKNDKLRLIFLGGMEEVGRNMTILENQNDIIIIDMGLQFPEEDMPGIDYIIPNISYLKDKLNKIRGVIITHAHYDHIGGIPHLMADLGNPIIYGTDLTNAIIRKRQEDYKNCPVKLRLRNINNTTRLVLGGFRLEFFKVTHNIPGSMGVAINTPQGIIIHTGDFKLDMNPTASEPPDISKIAQFQNRNVLALLSDSTNADCPGHQFTEKQIEYNLEEVFRQAKGRIIVATFASLLNRIQQIIWLAEKLGKKVAIEGFSMKTNVEIAKQLGYLKHKKNTIISLRKTQNIPDNKLIVVCTGAQGEDRAALMRIAHDEHKDIKIGKNDTVIFSSSVVPGNETSVQRLKDDLYRKGADVIHYQMVDIHAGGHAKQEDLKLMLKLVSPKYLIPIEGNLSLLKAHERLAKGMNFPEKNILIPVNGQIVEFANGQAKLTNKKVCTNDIMVDGLGVGDVSNIVLRDRRTMADDGMLVVIATVNKSSGKLLNNPDIISRGFIYMKENRKLIEQVRNKVKQLVQNQDVSKPGNEDQLKNKIRDEIGKFLFKETERRPLILPVIISL
ncbi:MAG: ribonuclease J [Patescibacteria group bacterium]|nr:ribonuclease J [Patescibacteria group bacterium]